MIGTALAIIGALAPFAPDIIGGLAGMLGGPKAGDAAKVIVDKATSVFGTSDPEKIKLMIAQEETKRAQFIAEIQRDTAMYQVEVEDRKDARARDLAIRSMPDEKGVPAGTNPRANIMLFGAFVMLLAILLGALFYRASIPDTVMAMLSMIAGGLMNNLTQAYNFEFGSSRGSADKSAAMQDIAAQAAKK